MKDRGRTAGFLVFSANEQSNSKRAMGFEPTTTCLEGRSSTAELHPRRSVIGIRNLWLRQVPSQPIAVFQTFIRVRQAMGVSDSEWAERDSNPRTPKRPDLQSGAIDRSAIRPTFLLVLTSTVPEPSVGIEPTTYGLQNRCTTAVLRWRPPGKLQYRLSGYTDKIRLQ